MRVRLVFLSLAGAAVLLAGPRAASAQDNALGVKIGLNLARFSVDEDAFDVDAKGRSLLLAGAFFRREISNGFGVQVEGLISQKGAKLVDTFFDDEYTFTINYLEIPVLARYSMPFGTGDMSVHAFAGPSFGLKLSDKQEINGEDLDEDLEMDIKSSDVGITFGAGLDFNMWVVDVRYTHGLTDINDDEIEEFPVKNRVFSVSVGYRFR